MLETASSVLWSALSKLKNVNYKVQMSESLPYRISAKIIGYIEFMALRKVGFIMNLHDSQPNFPNNV